MRAEFDLQSVAQGVLSTRFVGRLHYFESVESTNQLAIWAAQAGAEWGAWIADEQTAGRGRGGHEWHSAPGDGIYLSALVTPWVSLSCAQSLPMATGLAVRAAVRECTGLELDLRWPNDLMFGDRKCGGILVESASEVAGEGSDSKAGPRLKYAVIGIGLNIGHTAFPAAIKDVATSLLLESGREFDREPIAAAILRQLDWEIRLMRLEERGLHKISSRPVYDRFTLASSWVSGKRVRVGEDGGYTGWTRGLDGQGFLLVEDDSGLTRTVLSGGVRSA